MVDLTGALHKGKPFLRHLLASCSPPNFLLDFTKKRLYYSQLTFLKRFNKKNDMGAYTYKAREPVTTAHVEGSL